MNILYHQTCGIKTPRTYIRFPLSLRGQKVKLKVSGQYQSVDTAEYFADIRTYIETCYRNGIDTFAALVRLTSGNPYSVTELLGQA